MDPSYFGLNGDPFARTEPADVGGEADDHAGLTTELHAGLKAPHGITLLIGDTGAGKSAFIRGFLAQLPDTYVTAYLPNAGPGLRHLLTEAIEQLGGTTPQGAQEDALIDTLRGLAKARAEHDRATLIVLDEAHELPAKTIERLGKLFGADPAEPSRLHLTLVGRAELLDRMNAANDRSILKHLVQVCRMDPMGPEDAFRYIADRVQKVGGIVDRLFTQEALKLVVQQSNGSPARIDTLCAAAMERAARKGRAEVDADAVTGAVAGAEDLTTDGDAVTTEKEPNTPTYFFHDDNSDENDAAAPADRPAMTAAPAPAQPAKAAGTSRRRLMFWAAGAAAVLAAFVATMTDRSTPTIPVAGRQADTVAKADGAGGQATAERATAGEKGPKKKIERAAAAAKDGDVPKLVAKRAAPAAAASSQDAGQQAASAPAADGPTRRPSFPAPEIPAATAPNTGDAAFPTSIPGPGSAPTAVAGAAAAKAAPAAALGVAAKPAPAAAEAAPVSKPAVGAPASAPVQSPPKPAAVATPAPTRAPIAPTRAPAAAAPKPAPTAAPAPKVVAPPAAVASASRTTPAGLFTVQIGAFSSRANAEAVLAKARGTAKDGRIIASTSGGKPIFRVVAGSFSSPAEANQHAAALRASGYSTFVRKLD